MANSPSTTGRRRRRRLSQLDLAIGADVQGALKEADARVQKSLKANDGEIAASAVEMKAELEKIKEQVENVE